MTTNEIFFKQSKRGRGRIKHAILKYYLKAYFDKVGSSYERLTYIDGFAGSGYYKDDNQRIIEEGSPIIAYRTAVEHQSYDKFTTITLIFIEADETTFEDLVTNLKPIEEEYKQWDKIKVIKIKGFFDEEVTKEILDKDYKSDPNPDPLLIFMDPFGVKGIPMKLMKQLINRPKTELIINVMFSSINEDRFNHQNLYNAFNEFLGEENNDWRETVFNGELPNYEHFVNFYLQKLKANTTSKHFHYIFPFKDLRDNDIYQIVFITTYMKGMENMKRAMVNCSQQSDRFVYSELSEREINEGNQLPSLMNESQRENAIIQLILNRFKGQDVKGSAIAWYVWCKTPHIFNLKNRFRDEDHYFYQFISEKSKQEIRELNSVNKFLKFGDISFDFTNI